MVNGIFVKFPNLLYQRSKKDNVNLKLIPAQQGLTENAFIMIQGTLEMIITTKFIKTAER